MESQTNTTIFKTIVSRSETPIVIEAPLTQLSKFFSTLAPEFVPNVVDIGFGIGTIASLIIAVCT